MKLYRVDAATTWSVAFWLVFGLAPVLPWAGWHSDSSAAAWVQAYGSIAAILASAACALWIFRQQDLQAQETKRVDRALAIQTRGDLLKVIGKLFADADRAFPGLVPGDIHHMQMNYILQRVEEARGCMNEFSAPAMTCSADMLLWGIAKVQLDVQLEVLKAFAAGDATKRDDVKNAGFFFGIFVATDFDRMASAMRAGDREALDRILDGHVEPRQYH